MSDPRERSLGRKFFIMAKGQGKYQAPEQDQSAAAKRARKEYRDKVSKEQGKRFSQTTQEK